MLNQYLLDDGDNASEFEKIRRRNATPRSIFLWITVSLVTGIAWAYSVTSDSADVGAAVLEYIFYSTWILKFVPQFYLSAVRKTTIGLSIDTLYFSLLAYGFCCVYCFSTFYQLVAFNQETTKDPAVTSAEIALSMLCFLGTFITILQTYYFDGYARIRVSRKTNFILSLFMGLNFLYLILVASNYVSTSIAISLNEWVASLPYSFGVLFAIRYIPQSWRFYRAQMFQGVALSSIWIEFVGSVSVLIMIVYQGYRCVDRPISYYACTKNASLISFEPVTAKDISLLVGRRAN